MLFKCCTQYASKFGKLRGGAGEGNGKPTPVLLPGKSHGEPSLVGYSPPRGCKELHMTKRLSTAVATGLEKASFHSSPNKAMPKSAQTTTQPHSFHMAARSSSKSFKPDFNSTWTEIFQMYKLGLEKSRAIRDQIVNIHWLTEKAREFQKNIYFCFTDYAKAFDCVHHNKLWKILKEMGIPDQFTCLLRNL